jgi:hypothetical protein
MSVPMVRDSFETGTVDPATWKDKQIEPHQVAFSNGAAEGEKAVVITTTSRDGGVSCGDNPCQRAELRLHGNLRPLYGEEVFFGFSFRMSGDIQPFGSNRTIIGQWKAPGDDSPILAQRFDNGVFHITIQDGPKRIVVASAEGDPDALDEFQSRDRERLRRPEPWPGRTSDRQGTGGPSGLRPVHGRHARPGRRGRGRRGPQKRRRLPRRRPARPAGSAL